MITRRFYILSVVLILAVTSIFCGCSTYSAEQSDAISISDKTTKSEKKNAEKTETHSFSVKKESKDEMDSSKNDDVINSSNLNEVNDTSNSKYTEKSTSYDTSSESLNNDENLFNDNNLGINSENNEYQHSEHKDENLNQISDSEDFNNSNSNPKNIDNDQQTNQNENTCYFLIECHKALESPKLSQAHRNVLPVNGIIFSNAKLEFEYGETVFDILQKITSQYKIQFGFSGSPTLGTAYVNGISNLYEFDCGERSGWIYSVNGSRPNYGCDKYTIKPGDEIRFSYTTEL